MKSTVFQVSTFTKLAAVVSAMLCALTLGLCVRSFYVCDTVTVSRRHTRASHVIAQCRGGLCLSDVWRTYDPTEPQDRWAFHYQQQPVPTSYPTTHFVSRIAGFNRWGFGWGYDPQFNVYANLKATAFIIPYPAVLVAFLVPTLIFSNRWRRISRRRYRRMHGKCTRCGYDLRGNPERCSECGHVPGGSGGRARISGGS